ncbi:MAG: GNAT family N-acetyltransferase [Anaerolineae bacterium]|nr:MAG: GNAT family N-acetyltransferase [Anaerolineae bacterium]
MEIRFEAEPTKADFSFIHQQSAASLTAKYGEPASEQLGAFIYSDPIANSENQMILGGIEGQLSGSWLYIDTLWLDESLRGKGYGVRLMNVIEQAAVQRGVQKAFLGTATFQAPAFYKKLGYQVVGEMPMATTAYHQFLMARQPLTPYDVPAETEIQLAAPPSEGDLDRLGEHLRDYNNRYIALNQSLFGAAFLKDESGKICGGITGYRVFESALFLGAIWMDEPMRGQGYETGLITTYEQAAMQNGILSAAISIADDDLAGCFEAVGYQVLGVFPDFPAGRTSRYLIKQKLA